MGFKDKSNYDDMGFSSPRRGQDRDRMDKRSLKVIVLVVILGILLCAAVVLIWVIYFSGDEAAPPKPVEPQVVASEVPLEEPPKGEVVIKTPTPAPIVTPQTQSGWYQEYIVQEGDTLESIIEEFTISRETILSVNPIKSIQEIKPGFTLKVPSRNGQLYTVQPGDSLSIITNRFNPTLGWKTLQELNGLKSENIIAGQKIFIPSPDAEARSYYTRFIRPSEGRTTGSYNQTVLYGEGQYVTLKGILIDGVPGSDVKASASGVVVDIANEVDGLGRLVVLSHDQGYKTTYAHLQEVLVKVGSQVKQGDTIALLGESGNVGRPSLYFQIEEEGIPLDPANFF